MILFTSISPRRKSLLQQIGFREKDHFLLMDGVANHDYPENSTLKDVELQAVMAARKKIRHVEHARILQAWGLLPYETVVVAADTVVYCNGFVLDTPMDLNPKDAIPVRIRIGEEKARQMLLKESGQVIHVITGLVAAQGDNLNEEESCAVVTEAKMKLLSLEEIESYISTGEPLDKAGAFGIQERGVVLFETIKGSYSNVVGLPLVEFVNLLKRPKFKGRVNFPFDGKILPDAVPPNQPKLTVVSVGDINYDLVYSEFPAGFFTGLQPPGIHQEGKLSRAVGGTAVIFASKARKAGFTNCSVLGVIGGDAIGEFIEKELHDNGIETLLTRDRNKDTGVALLLRDSAEKDTALTITDARQSLTTDHVRRAKSDVERADVVFVSGYCLTDQSRREAAREVIALAKKAGGVIVFDVTVDMEKSFDYATFTNLLSSGGADRANVDVLVSEIPTILAWLGVQGKAEDDWEHICSEVLPFLHRDFTTVFLRTSTYSHELISTRADELNSLPPRVIGPITLDYSHCLPNDRLGYGDELTANHLYEYMSPRLLLASASPRRFELLKQIVVENKVEVRVSKHTEVQRDGETPFERVKRLALEKARQILVAGGFSRSIEIVIGADTEIILQNEQGEYEEIGHPSNDGEARQDLRRLSGKTHKAITGIALIQVDPKIDKETDKVIEWISTKEETEYVSTQVTFRELSDDEIDAYVRSGEPFGKAGAYGIQGRGALLIAGIEGSYSNVVGLPLERLSNLLASKFDMPIWNIVKVSNWTNSQRTGNAL